MIFGAVEINFAHFVYNLKRYYIYNIIQSSGKCQLVNSLIGTCLDSDIGKSSQTFYLVTLQGLHIMQYLTSHANVTSIALKCLNKEQPVALLPNSNWQFFQKQINICSYFALMLHRYVDKVVPIFIIFVSEQLLMVVVPIFLEFPFWDI